MKKKPVLWSARVITLLYVLFLVLFSFDAIQTGNSFFKNAGGFFIHNIPGIILILFIILTWKRPLIAGIVFILGAVFFTWFFHTIRQGIDVFAVISLPLLIVGGLYFLAFFENKKQSKLKT